MGNFAFLIAQQVQQGGLATSLEPLYYAVAILFPLIGGLWALRRYAANQRQQNVEQGIQQGQLADKLDANTRAAEKNTASIEKLGEKFDVFSSAIDKRMTLADYRIDKLEEKIHGNGLLKHVVRRDDDSV